MKKINYDQFFFNSFNELKIKGLDRYLKSLIKINTIKVKYKDRVPFKKGVPMEGFWMATIGGLVYYDKSMSTFQDVVHPDIFGRYVSSIYSGHNGDLWIYVPQSEGMIQFKTTNF